jgi:hypothetical protein
MFSDYFHKSSYSNNYLFVFISPIYIKVKWITVANSGEKNRFRNKQNCLLVNCLSKWGKTQAHWRIRSVYSLRRPRLRGQTERSGLYGWTEEPIRQTSCPNFQTLQQSVSRFPRQAYFLLIFIMKAPFNYICFLPTFAFTNFVLSTWKMLFLSTCENFTILQAQQKKFS